MLIRVMRRIDGQRSGEPASVAAKQQQDEFLKLDRKRQQKLRENQSGKMQLGEIHRGWCKATSGDEDSSASCSSPVADYTSACVCSDANL